MVVEYLFKAGFPFRVALSGRCGKSRNRGSSGWFCFARFDGSMVDEHSQLTFVSNGFLSYKSISFCQTPLDNFGGVLVDKTRCVDGQSREIL